jgi:hypothetical protein
MNIGALVDPGLLITGAAVFIAFGWGRGKWLRHLLLLSWVTSVIGAFVGATMSTLVFNAIVMDFVVAGGALIVTTRDPCRIDARMVGGISIALMPAHWVVSWNGGLAAFGWVLYAGACNAGFVLQCLIVRGWLDGVGRGIGRFVGRFVPVSLFHDGGR